LLPEQALDPLELVPQRRAQVPLLGIRRSSRAAMSAAYAACWRLVMRSERRVEHAPVMFQEGVGQQLGEDGLAAGATMRQNRTPRTRRFMVRSGPRAGRYRAQSG
jgi:hypothetical protein